MSISATKLIEEVKKRPGLYSTEHPIDREEKLSLWREIGERIFPDWAECNKGAAYDRVIQLQKKWRSLRDAYNREMRWRKLGVKDNKREYMHFKSLSFLSGASGSSNRDSEENANLYSSSLQDTSKDEEYESNEIGDVDRDQEDDDPLVNTIQLLERPRRKRKKKQEATLPEETEVAYPMELGDETDSDRLFLMSFAPEMRQLPSNIKMWARAQIANIMQEAVSCQYNNTMPGISKMNFDIKHRRDSLE